MPHFSILSGCTTEPTSLNSVMIPATSLRIDETIHSLLVWPSGKGLAYSAGITTAVKSSQTNQICRGSACRGILAWSRVPFWESSGMRRRQSI